MAASADTGHRRLEALAALWDPGSFELLDRLGLRSGWRCLEVGSGTGSLARWLTYRCPRGEVVATDVDMRFLDDRAGEGRPNLCVLRHDVVEGPEFAAGPFDLVRTRAVLVHLPDRAEVVARMARWLMVEEPAISPASSSPHPLPKAGERLIRLSGTQGRIEVEEHVPVLTCLLQMTEIEKDLGESRPSERVRSAPARRTVPQRAPRRRGLSERLPGCRRRPVPARAG
ncbi:class I SAM-dependent methyltransferase [Streptomyces acidiscabies]|uniref:Class I SAM-dependent methyltransferase n=1 Tax=Streptomyces acidiscabies TaxID=42234 RepID=A0AAP6BFC4_9ACTN|nr:class I SAM-dependent methyltransferase [Streptomyces acidiscabies]MBZ3913589.1 class I SAM-dependent methyltransferase [Streptomyces acidiscabies]MDX2963427.1 class I SAM-dependent methyltransferase [Streptomyces acidiscabies]MDX3023161.1 class I SAM-dependent methyltransferase [Streptomyces acidiscabies]MDX3792695.1 class I SAM-dependent methyltransferase [Streptomyces acidiscabies]GAQ51360.1 hypothetical protein a10_01140 [Streptomyces acidiscabies]